MKEYINPHNYAVTLVGPNGEIKKLRAKRRILLPEYYDKYRIRGFINYYDENQQSNTQTKLHKVLHKKSPKSQPINKPKPVRRNKKTIIAEKTITHEPTENIQSNRPRIVGRRDRAANPTHTLLNNLRTMKYPISNNIGVGILSYNRLSSLKRLVDSIIKYTDLSKTTIFISDDGSSDPNIKEYLKLLPTDIVVLSNEERIGIAGNSNRILKCLSRFKYGIILNDDVEIINNRWEYFYPEAMESTGFHHFAYRQPGVYGASLGSQVTVNDTKLWTVPEKPHGAVLAYTNHAFQTIGYFNETYGLYGMEHVDWSQRIYEFELQPVGFYDVDRSKNYFKLHAEPSSITNNRTSLLKEARQTYANRIPRQKCTTNVVVPRISYVVPFRETERSDSIISVVNNIRAQRFPDIEIILTEHDINSKIDQKHFSPVEYYLCSDHGNGPFNKSMIFNLGVSHVTSPYVILHDADMLTADSYTKTVYDLLQTYDGCHLGKLVIYTDKQSTNLINTKHAVTNEVTCERVVGYFEGGSIACRVSTYWNVGAFNQDFIGYGCEDCDFYARLADGCKWIENRIYDLVHLWHGRIAGWDNHHEINRALESKLKRKSIQDRINLQHQQLMKVGYGPQLQTASNGA